MCGGGGGKSSKVVPAPPIPQDAVEMDQSVKDARDNTKKKLQQAAGVASTNKTNPALAPSYNTSKKTLLG